jgi:mono/diheme cytochrome c family protein
MGKFRLAFAITSVVFLGVLAVSPLKGVFTEWRAYQHQFNRFITELPQRVHPVQVGIKQIWAKKFRHVDRCVTCHLGTSEKSLANAPQPYRRHSDVHHDPEEFGCTVCHGGQGPATTKKEAHGEVDFWDQPMLPLRYVEASCGHCHGENIVTDAPVLTRGRELIRDLNCAGCHKIEGYAIGWVPDLDGIGSKVNRSWLKQWLKHPKGYYSGATMPNFLLKDEEADVLADFLMTFKSFSGNAQLLPLPKSLTEISESEQDKLVSLGETRFREARCISCHPINGRGGHIAPDLGKVASCTTIFESLNTFSPTFKCPGTASAKKIWMRLLPTWKANLWTSERRNPQRIFQNRRFMKRDSLSSRNTTAPDVIH